MLYIYYSQRRFIMCDSIEFDGSGFGFGKFKLFNDYVYLPQTNKLIKSKYSHHLAGIQSDMESHCRFYIKQTN